MKDLRVVVQHNNKFELAKAVKVPNEPDPAYVVEFPNGESEIFVYNEGTEENDEYMVMAKEICLQLEQITRYPQMNALRTEIEKEEILIQPAGTPGDLTYKIYKNGDYIFDLNSTAATFFESREEKSDSVGRVQTSNTAFTEAIDHEIKKYNQYDVASRLLVEKSTSPLG